MKSIRIALSAMYFATMFFFPMLNFADSLTPCKTIEGGYYLGISAGYDIFSIKDTLDFEPFYFFDPSNHIDGVSAGVFAGYRKFFERFYHTYLGAEFYINGSSADDDYQITFNNDTFTTDFNIISKYGLSLIPGIQLNPIGLFYLRLGYNWAKIEVNEMNINPNLPPIEFNYDHTFHGLNYGLGIETLLFDRMNLRFEYQWTQYNTVEMHEGVSISPLEQQWLMGLVYSFY